jgi:hypothetical protein
MKVTVSEPKAGIKYPCLMIGSRTGVIVLFNNYGEGTVVNETEYHDTGYASEDWDMSQFTPYNGTVTLQND